jgi:hypothetical protein
MAPPALSAPRAARAFAPIDLTALDRWTQARITLGARSATVAPAQAQALAARLRAVVQAAGAAADAAPAAQSAEPPGLQVELRDEAGTLAVFTADTVPGADGQVAVRWQTVSEGREVIRSARIDARLVQALVDEAARLAGR